MTSRTIAWAAVSLCALACGSKGEQQAPAAKAAPDARVTVAKPVDAASAPTDAAVGAAVDLAALPELGAHGPDGEVEVHLADAPVSVVRNVLARLGKVSVIEPHDATRLSGRIGPTTDEHAWSVVTGGALGATARAVKRSGKGVDVDLDFAEAQAVDVYRLLGLLQRENVVFGASKPQALDLRVRELPADQVLRVVTERLGLTRERAGAVTWIHDASLPALDPALLARKGAGKVSLDVKDARPGEVYALLAKLGAIEDGAACDAGAATTFRLKDAPLGSVVAVTAALTGQAPVPNVACAGGIGDGDLADLALFGIARLGTKRVAGFRSSGAVVVIERGTTLAGARVTEIGEGYVTFERDATDGGTPESIAVSLFPSELMPDAPDDSPSPGNDPSAHVERTLENGRLAATFIGGDDARERHALFELPDGRWHLLDGRDLAPLDSVRIVPGRVIYQPSDPIAPPRLREVVLRTSR